jgi:uncharacterized membrane protein
VALGAGIGLAGQIFHVQDHWPSGILLWAMGAWAGVRLLRDWPQTALAAFLTPAWITGEWVDRRPNDGYMILGWVMLLCFTYISAWKGREASEWRQCLVWIGSIALLPVALAIVLLGGSNTEPRIDGVIAAVPLLGLAWLLRREDALVNVATAIYVWLFIVLAMDKQTLLLHAWAGVGAVGMVAWGVVEFRPERINLGIAGFAITVLSFYFSTLLDKLGRSLSLMILGVIFLAGGWQLERLRRSLLGRIRSNAAGGSA